MQNKLFLFWQSLSKTERILYLTTWIVGLALLFHGVLAVWFYNFYHQPSVTYPGGRPFSVVDKTIKKGDPIQVLVRRCSEKTYTAHISRQIVDGISYTIPESVVPFKKGCVTETRFIPDVTKALPPGKYHIESDIEITERWLWFSRVDHFFTSTENFTIIPAGK